MNSFASIHRVIVTLAFFLIVLGCNQTRAKIPYDLPENRFIRLKSGAIYDTKTDMAWYIGPDKELPNALFQICEGEAFLCKRILQSDPVAM